MVGIAYIEEKGEKVGAKVEGYDVWTKAFRKYSSDAVSSFRVEVYVFGK